MLWAKSCPDDPHAFFGIDRRGFEVGRGETVEIDDRSDLFLAEAVLRSRVAQPAGPRPPHVPHLTDETGPRAPLRRAC
jgi:hypothetical protein